ncbi:hypothetical protein COCNU_10G005090 [Cocos nucifera]|uniref:Uncharacterized protein n=1 Tax=Cocos nucifera TaxID=13894 RepID=A0A8K0N7P5_COCNU|nr:hypothetical protein COCNU_10G005090 [Cocos nucifera]
MTIAPLSPSPSPPIVPMPSLPSSMLVLGSNPSPPIFPSMLLLPPISLISSPSSPDPAPTRPTMEMYYLAGPGLFIDDHGFTIYLLDGHGYFCVFSFAGDEGTMLYSVRFMEMQAKREQQEEEIGQWRFMHRGPSWPEAGPPTRNHLKVKSSSLKYDSEELEPAHHLEYFLNAAKVVRFEMA